jgi:xanthine dehydrogenase accessory factor
MFSDRKVLVKGTGEVASACARRLHLVGFSVLLTERELPASPAPTSFAKALTEERVEVSGLTGIKIDTPVEAEAVWRKKYVAVLLDPEAKAQEELSPEIVVDARMASSNMGTTIDEAPVVVGVGPGFEVGVDCGAVVGATPGAGLGWASYASGESVAPQAAPTVVAGGGAAMISPAEGSLKTFRGSGQRVRRGEIVAEVNGKAIRSPVAGTIKSLLPAGSEVTSGQSLGEILSSEKPAPVVASPDSPAAISGGVLEAVLYLLRK